jgi:hypothetical protein
LDQCHLSSDTRRRSIGQANATQARATLTAPQQHRYEGEYSEIFQVFTDPDAFVDKSTEVFGECP